MSRPRRDSRRSPVRRALLAAIGFYSRAISPALPPRCRFLPTCSAYAAEAIGVYGPGRGTGLALVRLAKCAPWHPGGFDPVPGVGPPPAGTSGDGRSSNPAASPGAPVSRVPPSVPATPPAARRAGQEETSVV